MQISELLCRGKGVCILCAPRETTFAGDAAARFYATGWSYFRCWVVVGQFGAGLTEAIRFPTFRRCIFGVSLLERLGKREIR